MVRRPVDTGWSHAPGTGDLTNPTDPRDETPDELNEPWASALAAVAPFRPEVEL